MRHIRQRAGEDHSQQAACAGQHARPPPERDGAQGEECQEDDDQLADAEGDKSRSQDANRDGSQWRQQGIAHELANAAFAGAARRMHDAPLDALQLDQQGILDQQIGKIFSDASTFVHDGERGLGDCPYGAKSEFQQESTLVYLLQESRTQGVGDFKHGAQHAPSQWIRKSVFIRVHPRPISFYVGDT